MRFYWKKPINRLLQIKKRCFVFLIAVFFFPQLFGCVSIENLTAKRDIDIVVNILTSREKKVGDDTIYYRAGISYSRTTLKNTDKDSNLTFVYLEFPNTNKYFVPGIEYGFYSFDDRDSVPTLSGIGNVEKKSRHQLGVANLRFIRYMPINKFKKELLPYIGAAYGFSNQEGNTKFHQIPHILAGILIYPEQNLHISIGGRFLTLNGRVQRQEFNQFGDASISEKEVSFSGFSFGVALNYLF